MNEPALHGALAIAGRPYYFYVVKLRVDKGADVNAKSIPDKETGAFMQNVRTKGETPLHRAAAYADEKTITYLIEHGADKRIEVKLNSGKKAWVYISKDNA